MQKMKTIVVAFFKLPLIEEMKFAMAANDPQGYGQACVVSEQQKLDWCDIITLKTLPLPDKSSKFWPFSVPDFKRANPLRYAVLE
ncbi:hypothetical protein V6N12_006686 [Hibiscus sabdariffa]|uniref:Non-haem dioxygenase N-terminal domain-containing protein n=1 Tax=Hibiscus sabdariffa TaxID=183260 RepID=A0ABR2EZK4_9ROSI